MNPLTQINHFLSPEGLAELRSKFTPPPSAFDIKYDSLSDSLSFLHIDDQSGKEQMGSLSFTTVVSRELRKLLKNINIELDEKTFSINNDQERENFSKYALQRINDIFQRWSSSDFARSYPETIVILTDFKECLETNLSYYKTEELTPKSPEQTLNLPNNFNLPKLNLKAERLNLRQSALLFDYLLKHKAILNYNDSSLAEIVSTLTGHSKQNLRAAGFGLIKNIKRGWNKDGEPINDRNKDLNELKDLLLSIIKEIDEEALKNIK
ncbi:hypothetical protein [Pontibacter populi]|uniref:Uncharacterized protein n=1 Tax=Pontibacter populi TaxID=890055 RepID=A0ABV1RSM3_9BACT